MYPTECFSYIHILIDDITKHDAGCNRHNLFVLSKANKSDTKDQPGFIFLELVNYGFYMYSCHASDTGLSHSNL